MPTKPKLDNKVVLCLNCDTLFNEQQCSLKHASRANGRDYYNTECPHCGAVDQLADASSESRRAVLHEHARQRWESVKGERQMRETVEVDCPTCGDTIEVKRRDKYYYEKNVNPAECDDCRRERTIECLRDCLDPDHDGTFSRANALRRLKHEYDQMPIVDHDGSLITELDVQHGSGFGVEPDGLWIERIVMLTDCEKCDYDKARYSFKANCFCEPYESLSCPDCGFERSDP